MRNPMVVLVVCDPIADGPPRQPSGEAKCCSCEEKVWVANSTTEKVQKLALDTRVVCTDCALVLPPARSNAA